MIQKTIIIRRPRPTAGGARQRRGSRGKLQVQGTLALFSSCLVALGVFFVAKLNVCDVFKYASSLSLKLFTTIIDAKVLSWLTVWPVLFWFWLSIKHSTWPLSHSLHAWTDLVGMGPLVPMVVSKHPPRHYFNVSDQGNSVAQRSSWYP